MDTGSIFVHMDDDWMWRWYICDRYDRLIIMSEVAYFTHGEAKQAVDEFLAMRKVA